MSLLEPARCLLTRDHREIDVAVDDQTHAGARVRGDELEAHRRVFVEQVAQHRRQEPLAEIVAGRDPQGRGRAPGKLGELAERRLGPAPELTHDGQRRLARGGQPHAPAGALEELHAEVGLELADLLAHGRRGDVALARGRPDRARARHRQQSLEGGKERGVDHVAELIICYTTFHWTTRLG